MPESEQQRPFAVGDVVKHRNSPPGDQTVKGVRDGELLLLFDDGSSGWYNSFRCALVRPASPPDRDGGWVPKVGDRARVRKGFNPSWDGCEVELRLFVAKKWTVWDGVDEARIPTELLEPADSGSVKDTIECLQCNAVMRYSASYTDGQGNYFCCRDCCGRYTRKHEQPQPAKVAAREWDCDKYNGLDAATYAQLSNLDKRIAAARAELDRELPRQRRDGRYDPRPIDLEQAWSSPSWESDP